MVAALLRAMDYHTPFVAPKGKDGGIDIIAYLDPLGAKTPRIKVQVKHKPDTAIGAAEVRALSGVLKAGDIALFVTSGTYSADARNAASGNDKFIRLIDGNDFIEMWQEYYDKMTDEDKNMLPLKRIAFLGNNEVSLGHSFIAKLHCIRFSRIKRSTRYGCSFVFKME